MARIRFLVYFSFLSFQSWRMHRYTAIIHVETDIDMKRQKGRVHKIQQQQQFYDVDAF